MGGAREGLPRWKTASVSSEATSCSATFLPMNPAPPTARTRMESSGLAPLGPGRRVPERRLGTLAPLVERADGAIDIAVGDFPRGHDVGARADQNARHVVDVAAPIRVTDAASE